MSGPRRTARENPRPCDALGDLERAVRTAAAGSELGSAQAGELLAGVDALASLRRERLATSAHELPALYLAVVMAAGLALVVDAAALAIDRSHRIAWLTAGLVVVVSLVLALLLAVTAPFRGGFITDGEPIDGVIVDLDAGVFTG